jgi:phosphonoacetaldehyde hydrolase
VPRQLECLERYSDVIRGVPEVAERLRSRGVRIGSTTGYTRPMLDFLLGRAREQGFAPDCAVCPEDVEGGGRPAPWMCYLNAVRMQVSPLWSMVKIGDTPSDMAEGLNAGMWTIGVMRTGNEAGLTEEEWNSKPAAQRASIISRAAHTLRIAGAHYVTESAGECLDVIDEVAGRIGFHERP